MLYFLMKGKSQKKHSLGEKERKVLVICFTNGLTNGMDTQRQIKPVVCLQNSLAVFYFLALQDACCLLLRVVYLTNCDLEHVKKPKHFWAVSQADEEDSLQVCVKYAEVESPPCQHGSKCLTLHASIEHRWRVSAYVMMSACVWIHTHNPKRLR